MTGVVVKIETVLAGRVLEIEGAAPEEIPMWWVGVKVQVKAGEKVKQYGRLWKCSDEPKGEDDPICRVLRATFLDELKRAGILLSDGAPSETFHHPV